MHLANYLVLLGRTERTLAEAFEAVSDGHERDAGVHFTARTLAAACRGLADELRPVEERYRARLEEDLERLHVDPLPGVRAGEIGLVRDLQDLYVLASLCDVTWLIVGQAARGVRDRQLLQLVEGAQRQTGGQLAWLRSQLSSLSPQALVAT